MLDGDCLPPMQRYPWVLLGKGLFLDDVPADKNTGRYMMTTKYLPAKEGDVEGERRFMHIDGVLACAAGYVNDPALVGESSHLEFAYTCGDQRHFRQ